MDENTTSRATDDNRAGCRRDAGVSFIEVLVAIVLLGTVVIATLTGLHAAIIGTQVDEDHARAYAWLQAASDEIYDAAYLACSSTITAAQIVTSYQTAANGATRPNDWPTTGTATITVNSVQFLSRSGSDDLWGTNCAADNVGSPIYPQLVTITVKDPSLQFSATIEVIKSV